MKTIIGVRFRQQGKVYYFDPREFVIPRGAGVIVETSQGPELGVVVMPNQEMEESRISGELKPVKRIATEEDVRQLALNQRNEKDAIRICREKIAAHGLEMKLIKAEYAFDRSKLTFFFTAEGRVDFRDLVKDLASVFRTRIELRQVGVRDETKLLGGIGVCGRPLCCATWLPDFVPVSIKMAKEQNLSLNSAKISGVCGRLMCCLKNEEDTYEYLNAQLPDVNSEVTTPEGVKGRVQSVNVLKQKVSVVIDADKDDREVREYAVEELKFTLSPKKERKLNGEKPEKQEKGEKSEKGDRPEKSEKRNNGKNQKQRGDKSQRQDRQKAQQEPRAEKPQSEQEQ